MLDCAVLVGSLLREVLVLAALGLAGCHSRSAESPSAELELGDPVQFTFGTLDGGELSSDTTRGRTTALLLVTTYDLPSQAEAQLLESVLVRHRPRANGAIVMLEPPRSAPLAQVWRDSLGIRLPIAMASPSLMSGESELGLVRGVPTLLVLDRRGRLVGRFEGAATRQDIEGSLERADAR
jgi:hypothetical protein